MCRRVCKSVFWVFASVRKHNIVILGTIRPNFTTLSICMLSVVVDRSFFCVVAVRYVYVRFHEWRRVSHNGPGKGERLLKTIEAIQRWSAICRVWPWTLTYHKFLLCVSSQGQDLYSHQKLNMYIYGFSSESGYRRRRRRRRRRQRRTPQYNH